MKIAGLAGERGRQPGHSQQGDPTDLRSSGRSHEAERAEGGHEVRSEILNFFS